MNIFSQAYKYLIEQIDSGMEFPTAHENVCIKFCLSDNLSRKLIEEYDK